MIVNEQPQTSKAHKRGSVGVVIAVAPEDGRIDACLESVQTHTGADTPILTVAATAAAVNGAIERLAAADVAVLSEPCRVSDGWLERLGEAARSDTNTATASSLADVASELALLDRDPAAAAQPRLDAQAYAALAAGLATRTERLRPRIRRAVGPCVYLRREAIELVGRLDEELDLSAALEIDFAQRCLLSGLSHVACDDVVVGRIASEGHAQQREPGAGRGEELPARLLERYPYLAKSSALGESRVLARALEAARGPSARLSVTLDARALDGALTGTQVHVLELILALARTGALQLRLLVRTERINGDTLKLLRGLPHTEVLAAEDDSASTAASAIFHRPQQTFEAADVALALALGERVVLSQLDLIAYRNPGYFPDAEAWEDYRRASRHGLSAAERVVVFSEHTRGELRSDALVEDERVRIVAPGLDHRAPGSGRRPAALDAGARTSTGGDEPRGFLLCLGTDFRHKNRAFALRLLAALREIHGWDGSLVLAGTHINYGSSRELERAVLEEHPGVSGSVIELGAVSEAEKAWLMEHAGAVVYPSVYEGFGLVPFESALNGTPCVFAS